MARYNTCTLGEIGQIVSGATPRTSEADNFGGDIAWITPADLSGYTAKYISRGARNLTKKGYDSCGTKLMPGGTVLFSSRAPIGYVAIADNPICTNQGFKSIVPNDGVFSEFLYYQLKYLKKSIQDLGSGTTFKEISAKKFATIKVVLPPLQEQKRIVAKIEELFSELDNGVATLEKTKQQLAVYRQAVLRMAFENHTSIRKRLAEIGEVCLGRQRSPKNVAKDYPTKYIRAANIAESGLLLDDILEMEFTPKEREKYYLKKGDIVVAEASGSATQVGKPAVWNDEISNCCFQNTVIRLRLSGNLPEYVFWYLKFLYMSGAIAAIVGGVGINHLGANKFSNIEIPVPTLKEQAAIVSTIESRLSVCDNIEKTVDAALQQAASLRQGILKKAFEGRL